MNYKKELDNIQSKIESNKIEKARTEERLNQSEKEKKNILAKLKEEGIKEEELQSIIADLEITIQKEIEKCKKQLKLT